MVRAKRAASLLLVVLLLLPLGVYAGSMLWQGGEGGVSVSGSGIVLHGIVGPGDSMTFYHVVYVDEGNGSVVIDNETFIVRVNNVGWPFSNVTVYRGNYSVDTVFPTMMLFMPVELLGQGLRLASAIHVSLFDEWVCLEVEYQGTSEEGVFYIARTPDYCNSLVASYEYRSDGLLESLSIMYVIGDVLYRESYRVVAVARSGQSPYGFTVESLTAPECMGYYSTLLEYTLPGAYYAEDGTVSVYYRFEAVAGERPLLVIVKDSRYQEVWELVTNGSYDGYVVVLSPLLRDFWRFPYYDLAEEYGVVLVTMDNETVTGVERVKEYILVSARHT